MATQRPNLSENDTKKSVIEDNHEEIFLQFLRNHFPNNIQEERNNQKQFLYQMGHQWGYSFINGNPS